jgi:hypothetical protein
MQSLPPISVVCSNARPLSWTKKCNGCVQSKPLGKYAIRQWRKGKTQQLCQDCSCLTVTPPDMPAKAIKLDACGILNESASNKNAPPNFSSPHRGGSP